MDANKEPAGVPTSQHRTVDGSSQPRGTTVSWCWEVNTE